MSDARAYDDHEELKERKKKKTTLREILKHPMFLTVTLSPAMAPKFDRPVASDQR